MKSKYITIILSLVIALMYVIPVYGSNISTALHSCIITISNNSTSANTNQVVVINTINTTAWVTAGLINSSGNNTAIISSSGVEVAYMIGYQGNGWPVFVQDIPGNTNKTDILYYGGTANMDGKIRFFPGLTGMVTADAASMEPLAGDNFTIEQSGQIDTSEVGKELVFKDGAFRTYIGAAGNITSEFITGENFEDYTEVDANNKLTVTPSKALAADSDSDEDVYLYYDHGLNHFNALDVDFTILIESTSEDNSQGGMGIENTIGQFGDLAATDVCVQFVRLGVADYRIYLYRGAGVALDNTAALTVNADTPYYCTLTRAAANDTVILTIYSDTARAVLVDTLTVAGYNGATRWQYSYGFQSYDRADGGGKNFDGYVSDMDLTGGGGGIEASIAGIASGDIVITTTVNNTSMQVGVDGVLGVATPLAGTTFKDNSNDWEVSDNETFDYLLHHKQWSGGNLVQHIEFEYGPEFGDLSGNSNNATPSFRLSDSSPNISAILSSCSPISEAEAPAYTLSDAPDFFTVLPGSGGGAGGVTGNFTINATPTYPTADVIRAIALAGSVPENLVTFLFSGFALILLSLCVSKMMKVSGVNSLFIKLCIITAVMCLLVAVEIFDVWQVYFFVLMGLSLCWLSRQREAY